MTANLDLVRSIYADWERGDFSGADWAHPEVELVFAGGPDPASWTGLAAIGEAMRSWISAWEDFRIEAEEYRELADERVLVLAQGWGRGKASGLELAQLRTEGAELFTIRSGKIIKLVRYLDRDRALADLGLEE